MRISGTLDEQAAAWSERLSVAPTPRIQSEFTAWVGGDQERLAAFTRADGARRMAIALADEPDMRRLRAETLARVDARKRVRLQYRNRIVGMALAGGAMAASVLLILQFAFSQAQMPSTVLPQTDASSVAVLPGTAILPARTARLYETKVGEQRVVQLADTSSIILDSDTGVSVRYTGGERAISLIRGQAYFKVAHDSSRPFIVTAGKSKVIALGTEFDVSIARDRLAVHLVEGRLRIEKSGKGPLAGQQIATLDAGQKLLISSDDRISVERTDASAETEWRNGRLVFDHERLGDVVAKFNRYRRQPIRFEDGELADTLISGVFETEGSDAFVEAITSYFPIDAVKGEDGAISLRRRR